jgi:threonine/homoserine/homoserine lactone efflux protein
VESGDDALPLLFNLLLRRRSRMMDSAGFMIAVLALLLTPGPTNTLLVIAAATNGRRGALLLIPAEFSGYFVAICTLLLLFGNMIAAFPMVGASLRVGCALYLAYVACALWNCSVRNGGRRSVRFRDVFVTTLLNPKGLVFAFVIFPEAHGAPGGLWPYFGAFTAACIVVACLWVTFGTILRAGTVRYFSQTGFQRVGSLVMGCFAALLVVSLFTG